MAITPIHRWASTSILMSVISNIRDRHLLFRYRRQICRTENCHSDIDIRVHSDIRHLKKKSNSTSWIRTRDPRTRRRALNHSATILLPNQGGCQILDIGKEFIPISDIISDSALSVRYRWSQISDWVPTYAPIPRVTGLLFQWLPLNYFLSQRPFPSSSANGQNLSSPACFSGCRLLTFQVHGRLFHLALNRPF